MSLALELDHPVTAKQTQPSNSLSMLNHLKSCPAVTAPKLISEDAKEWAFKSLMTQLSLRKLGSTGVFCGQCRNKVKGDFRTHASIHGVHVGNATESLLKYGLAVFDQASDIVLTAGDQEVTLDGRRCSIVTTVPLRPSTWSSTSVNSTTTMPSASYLMYRFLLVLLSLGLFCSTASIGIS